ncbi:hypothetical protein BTJ49_05055 [Oleiagrimonas sp. MCCC 1A03011]|nr:hypothetical protein BTJ49_05055 [Oleiagrimonas sp. MCCC 1A03011]
MSYADVARGKHKQLGVEPIHPNHGRAKITGQELTGQKSQLRKVGLMPAMSGYDHLSLQRKRGQSSHGFTDFMVDTRRALHTLDSQPQGKSLLSQLNNGPSPSMVDFHSTVMIADARTRDDQGNTAKPQGMLAFRDKPLKHDSPGFGEATTVHYNPDIKKSDGSRPAFIGLGHELVHALRNQTGMAVDTNALDHMPKRKLLHTQIEEFETVGLLKAPQGITENSLRKEHGIAPRTEYSGMTPMPKMKELINKNK